MHGNVVLLNEAKNEAKEIREDSRRTAEKIKLPKSKVKFDTESEMLLARVTEDSSPEISILTALQSRIGVTH